MKMIDYVHAISTSAVLVGAAVVYAIFRNVTHQLVIHFDAWNGIDFFGTRNDVFNIAGIMLAMNFTNIALARYIETKDRFMAWLLTLGNALIVAIVMIAITVIIANNF